MGGKEKWGDFGAEPQHPGGFISGGTRPLSTTALPSHPLLQRLQLFGSMAFTGKYETESEKNYDEFMKRLGLSSDRIEKGRNFKVISEIQQDGQNFTWSQHYPGGHSISNNFTIGKETEMETVGNKKFKVTVKMEGGKVVVDSANYHHTVEIVDGKLVEVSVLLVPT
uniref:Fatty acid binding protein 6 n=1 Tax=Bos mutus grunniens TaxID=30521 RepID=A0A8B9Y0Q3_BOSMU